MHDLHSLQGSNVVFYGNIAPLIIYFSRIIAFYVPFVPLVQVAKRVPMLLTSKPLQYFLISKCYNIAKTKKEHNMANTFEVNAIYTVKQAAKILQLHHKTVLRLLKTGRIRAAVNPGRYRITGRAIQEYAEGRCVIEQHD